MNILKLRTTARVVQFKLWNNTARKLKLSAMLIALALTFFKTQTVFAQSNDEFLSALISLSPLRTSYSEYYQAVGERPSSIDDLGYSESDFQNELVAHVDISKQTGAILIGLDHRFGDKQWAALIPDLDSNLSDWICQTTVSEGVANLSGCIANVAYSRVDMELDSQSFNSTLQALNILKVNYTESYESNAEVPTSMRELGVDPDLLRLGNASHVMVDPNTQNLIVALDDEVFGLNHWVSLSPVIYGSYGIVYWSCRTTLPRNLVATRQCSTDQPVERMLF